MCLIARYPLCGQIVPISSNFNCEYENAAPVFLVGKIVMECKLIKNTTVVSSDKADRMVYKSGDKTC